MTFDEYVARLFSELHLERRNSYDVGDDLFEKIGLDSLQAFELILVTEEMAGLSQVTGLSIPPSDIPVISTLGDAYEYYLLVCQLANDVDLR